MDIREYEAGDGRSPFRDWFADLPPAAAAKVVVALARLGQGSLANLKGIGKGVLELRIDFGPGYRVYLGRDGEKLVILLTGGMKRRQPRDIAAAQRCWRDYRNRKKGRV
jgi:putative addiction module killer protein